jgi:hypothetical protein
LYAKLPVFEERRLKEKKGERERERERERKRTLKMRDIASHFATFLSCCMFLGRAQRHKQNISHIFACGGEEEGGGGKHVLSIF